MGRAERRWPAPLQSGIAALVALGLPLASSGCDPLDREEVRTLELWTLSLQPFEAYIQERIAAFERDHPGVEVAWTDVPFNGMERKLVAAASADRAPDLVNLSDLWFARYASLGAFHDLAPLLDDATLDRYLPGAMSVGRLNGRLLSLPWYLTTQTVLANQTLLASGGLSADDIGGSWTDLLERAGDFRARTGVHLLSQPLGAESQLPMMLLADGVAIFEQRGDRLAAHLDHDQAEAFVGRWVEAFRRGDLPREAATVGHEHLIELYQEGRVAVINTSPNFLRRIREVAPSVFDATAVRSPVTGRLGRPHIATMVLGVTTQADDPALAAQLAAHLTSPQSQLDFCRLVNILPSTPESLRDPLFDAPAAGADEPLLEQSRHLAARTLPEAVAFTPALADWPEMRRAFESHIQAALLDGLPVREALRRIERDWNRLLDASPPAWPDAVPTPPPLGAAP